MCWPSRGYWEGVSRPAYALASRGVRGWSSRNEPNVISKSYSEIAGIRGQTITRLDTARHRLVVFGQSEDIDEANEAAHVQYGHLCSVTIRCDSKVTSCIDSFPSRLVSTLRVSRAVRSRLPLYVSSQVMNMMRTYLLITVTSSRVGHCSVFAEHAGSRPRQNLCPLGLILYLLVAVLHPSRLVCVLCEDYHDHLCCGNFHRTSGGQIPSMTSPWAD